MFLGECPLDPGGYFIVKGTEKVPETNDAFSLSLSKKKTLAKPMNPLITGMTTSTFSFAARVSSASFVH